jgi:hypothetical protein
MRVEEEGALGAEGGGRAAAGLQAGAVCTAGVAVGEGGGAAGEAQYSSSLRVGLPAAGLLRAGAAAGRESGHPGAGPGRPGAGQAGPVLAPAGPALRAEQDRLRPPLRARPPPAACPGPAGQGAPRAGPPEARVRGTRAGQGIAPRGKTQARRPPGQTLGQHPVR